MRWLNQLFSRRRRYIDLSESIRVHLEEKIDDMVERGMSRDEASEVAHHEFGNVTLVEEISCEIWQWPIESIWSDLKSAARQLCKSPAFTLTALVTLTVGIGANTAIFTLVHGVLIKSLPVMQPKMLFRVGDKDDCCIIDGRMNHDGNFSLFSYDLYKHLRRSAPEFEHLAAMQAGNNLLSVRRGSEHAKSEISEFVSGNYFTTFGLKAFSGRMLTDADDVAGAPPAAVMSYEEWRSGYAGDPSLVGETLYFQGQPVTLIGIAPPGFFGDRIDTNPTALWIPLSDEPLIRHESSILSQVDENWLYILGRIKPGVTIPLLQENLSNSLRQWMLTQDPYTREGGSARIPNQHVVVVSGSAGIRNLQQQTSKGLFLLMAISGVLLLVACATVANLLLARGATRSPALSVRMALGAARSRLIRQMLTESILLGFLGGLAGLAVSYAGTRTILGLIFPGSARVPIQLSPSAPILGFAFLLSLLTGIAFGFAPAWMASRIPPAEEVRATNLSWRVHSSLLQRSLIVFQAALSLVLLVSAGLLTRSLRKVEHQNFGLQTANRYVLHLDPRNAGYTPEKLQALNRALEQRFAALPGMQSVGLALYSPLEGNNWSLGVFVDGRTPRGPKANIGASFDRVSPQFFQTVGEPIIRGRSFTDRDTPTTPMVAVVNQAFVKKFLPNENPIGKHFGNWSQEYAGSFEIIGIVADAKYSSPRAETPPMFFRPLNQWKSDLTKPNWVTLEKWSLYINSVTMLFRGQPQDLDVMVRRTLANIDPNLAVISLHSFDYQVSGNFSQERLIGRLTMLFGMLSLSLASIGLYRITSYQVARRISEIGLRLPLGADRSDVIWLVLREVFLHVGLGLAIGIPVALLAARGIENQLYQTRSCDPLSLMLAAAMFVSAGAAAGFIPARRAASFEPTKALLIE
jgi:predicted permease